MISLECRERVTLLRTSITMSARKITLLEPLLSALAADAWHSDVQEALKFTGSTKQPIKTNEDTSPCPNPQKPSISYPAAGRTPQNYASSRLSPVQEPTSAHADNLLTRTIPRNANSTFSQTYIPSIVAAHPIHPPLVLSEPPTVIITEPSLLTTASTLSSSSHAPASSALDPTHQSVALQV